MKRILIITSLLTNSLACSISIPCAAIERVSLSPYNPIWNSTYCRESASITAALGRNRVINIQHFGSTAIPGMIAKPIVDILVGLDEFKLEENEIEALKSNGYELIEKSPYCERFYFHKRGSYGVNVSITGYNSSTWRDCLNVRDYLINHPHECEAYMNVKLMAIMEGNIYVSMYSQYKSEFVKRLNERARAWRSDE